jgi:hypothetical protein
VEESSATPPFGGLLICWAYVKGRPKTEKMTKDVNTANAKKSAVRREFGRGAGEFRALELRFTLNIRSIKSVDKGSWIA